MFASSSSSTFSTFLVHLLSYSASFGFVIVFFSFSLFCFLCAIRARKNMCCTYKYACVSFCGAASMAELPSAWLRSYKMLQSHKRYPPGNEGTSQGPIPSDMAQSSLFRPSPWDVDRKIAWPHLLSKLPKFDRAGSQILLGVIYIISCREWSGPQMKNWIWVHQVIHKVQRKCVQIKKYQNSSLYCI